MRLVRDRVLRGEDELPASFPDPIDERADHLSGGEVRVVTKPGEDYPAMSGMKTIGEDNVLRLTVTVT